MTAYMVRRRAIPSLMYVWRQQGGSGVAQEKLDEVQGGQGFDKPVPIRYLNWAGNVPQGDLGKSICETFVPST
jgi:ABC-type dipeptide/oligopeptide/nickel transport system permease component